MPPSPPQILSPIRRWQFQAYHAGTALNHFLRRRIRPTGISFLLLIVLTSCLAAGNPDSGVYRIFSLCFSTILIALLWLPFRRASLSATRELPAHGTAGTPLRYRVILTNPHSHPVRRFSIGETLPDPRPPLETFLLQKEPGESERNLFDRFFAYYRWNWLCETRSLFSAQPDPHLHSLKPGESLVLHLEITPHRRGIILLQDLRLRLPDPFGLFERWKKLPTPAQSLAVLPRRYPLPPIELPGSARIQPGADAAARHAGSSGEFVGLRDYQPGDPLRLIHWATWARTGKPVVRELEDTFLPRHGLILDTFPRHGEDDAFEAAVSIAASFIVATDSRESLIDLMFIAGREQVISASQSARRSEILLETLAGVESSTSEDLQTLAQLVIRHAEDLAGCLVLFTHWSPSRHSLLTQLETQGIDTAAIVITGDDTPLPARCHRIRLSHLAQDLLSLPPLL